MEYIEFKKLYNTLNIDKLHGSVIRDNHFGYNILLIISDIRHDETNEQYKNNVEYRIQGLQFTNNELLHTTEPYSCLETLFKDIFLDPDININDEKEIKEEIKNLEFIPADKVKMNIVLRKY